MENEIKCPWCGSTDTNLDSIEDSFFEGSSGQVISLPGKIARAEVRHH